MQRKSIYRFFDRFFGIPILSVLAFFLKRKKVYPPNKIKNILIIKFAAIGDIILMIPMLRSLKYKYPDAKITFLCTQINYGMVKRVKYIDEIINYNIYSSIAKPFGFLKFLRSMRKNVYDIIIDAEQWPRISAILTILFRKKYSIGFKFEKQHRHSYYNAYTQHTNKRHEVENFLALAELIGINAVEADKELEFDLNQDMLNFAEQFWKENNLHGKFVICMQPGSGTNGYAREWKDENYIGLGKKINLLKGKVVFLLTGLKDDIERCNNICKNIGDNAINISGTYDMDRDLAIIKKSNLMICGNTGILHLAASIKTKTIGLHGPNNPVLWGAYDKNAIVVKSDAFCSPCLHMGHEFGCKIPFCMDRITIDEVYEKVIGVLTADGFYKPG
jgi:ADP-heptose:LPS heptosyltransferase